MCCRWARRTSTRRKLGDVTKVCVVLDNHPSAVMGGAQYQGHLLAEELARQPGAQVTYVTRRADAARCAADKIPYAVRTIGGRNGTGERGTFFGASALRDALEQL